MRGLSAPVLHGRACGSARAGWHAEVGEPAGFAAVRIRRPGRLDGRSPRHGRGLPGWRAAVWRAREGSLPCQRVPSGEGSADPRAVSRAPGWSRSRAASAMGVLRLVVFEGVCRSDPAARDHCDGRDSRRLVWRPRRRPPAASRRVRGPAPSRREIQSGHSLCARSATGCSCGPASRDAPMKAGGISAAAWLLESTAQPLGVCLVLCSAARAPGDVRDREPHQLGAGRLPFE